MDRWALQYRGQCTFVVACCDGKQLAQTFASELRLENVLNVWVDDASMPTWGQLGCQGFIIGDGRHSVVCKSTVAFMEVRELAFRHCETLVDALIGSDGPSLSSLATHHPGARVRLHSLSVKPELNGAHAIILEAASAANNERCAVQLRDGRSLLVKRTNLATADSTSSGVECCGGGCGGCADDGEDRVRNDDSQAEATKPTPDPAVAAAAARPLQAAERKLADASHELLEASALHMPARMLRSLQEREAVARKELAAAQAAARAVSAPAVAEAAAPVKKEAFKGGISLGVCANALCLCAECECGRGCTCNVTEEETCEPCTEFRAVRKAKVARS